MNARSVLAAAAVVLALALIALAYGSAFMRSDEANHRDNIARQMAQCEADGLRCVNEGGEVIGYPLVVLIPPTSVTNTSEVHP